MNRVIFDDGGIAQVKIASIAKAVAIPYPNRNQHVEQAEQRCYLANAENNLGGENSATYCGAGERMGRGAGSP